MSESRVDSNTFTMGNPMPESTSALCQSRLYPPDRDLGFGLWAPSAKPIAVYSPVCHGGIYIHKCKLYYIYLLKLTYTNHLSAQWPIFSLHNLLMFHQRAKFFGVENLVVKFFVFSSDKFLDTAEIRTVAEKPSWDLASRERNMVWCGK